MTSYPKMGAWMGLGRPGCLFEVAHRLRGTKPRLDLRSFAPSLLRSFGRRTSLQAKTNKPSGFLIFLGDPRKMPSIVLSVSLFFTTRNREGAFQKPHPLDLFWPALLSKVLAGKVFFKAIQGPMEVCLTLGDPQKLAALKFGFAKNAKPPKQRPANQKSPSMSPFWCYMSPFGPPSR